VLKEDAMAAQDAQASTPEAAADGQPRSLPGENGTTPRSTRLSRESAPEREPELAAQFAQLGLATVQQAYLSDRWLAQVRYLGRAARRAQRRHYALRLIAILGGVVVPSLIGLNVGDGARDVVRWLAFGLGLLVAAAVALEEFFRYGERWRHYRQQAELLRGEGWAFLELAGPAYRRYDTHAEAFRPFVARAEEASRQEVGVFIAEVVRTAEDRQGRDSKVGLTLPSVAGIVTKDTAGTAKEG
jgi:Protein of unknown function (DUF4231)